MTQEASVVDYDREEAAAARDYTLPAYDDRLTRREADAEAWERGDRT